ncbi:hypothetical protein GCK32_012795, partial [Trichostrongylus colubriformis]
GSSMGVSSNFNPFAAEAMSTQGAKKTSDDLLDLFNAPAQPPQPHMDATNPFAQFTSPNPASAQSSVYPSVGGVVAQPIASSSAFPESNGHSNGFQTDFVRAFSNRNTNDSGGDGMSDANPFLNAGQTAPAAGSVWQPELSSEQAPVTNTEVTDTQSGIVTGQAMNPFGANPFHAQGEFEHGLHLNTLLITPTFYVSGGTPQHIQHMDAQRFGTTNSSANDSPISFQMQQQQQYSQSMDNTDRQAAPVCTAETISTQPKPIYEQTPFSHTDGSYSGPSPFSMGAMQSVGNMPGGNDQMPAHENTHPQQQGWEWSLLNFCVLLLSCCVVMFVICTFDPFSTQQGQPKMGSDIDSALSNLADNLSISGNNQGRPVQWGGHQQQGPGQMQISSTAPAMASYGAPPQYTTPFGQYAPQAYPGQMPQWQVQQHVYPTPQHPQGAPSGYPVYGGAPMGYGQVAQPHPQSGQDPFGF